MKFCQECGSQLTGNAKFCSFCGAAVPQDNPPAPPQPETPQQPSNTIPAPEPQQWSPELAVSPGPAACSFCGSPVDPGSTFCENCGAKLSSGQQTPQHQQQTPQYQQQAPQHQQQAPRYQSPGPGNPGRQPPYAPPAPKKKKGGKTALIIILVVLLLAGIGVGVFFLVRHFTGKDPEKLREIPQEVTQQVNKKAVPEDYIGSYTGTFTLDLFGTDVLLDLGLAENDVKEMEKLNGRNFDVTAEFNGERLIVYCPDFPQAEEDGEAFRVYAWEEDVKDGIYKDISKGTEDGNSLSMENYLYYLKDGSLYCRSSALVEKDGKLLAGGIYSVELKPDFSFKPGETTEEHETMEEKETTEESETTDEPEPTQADTDHYFEFPAAVTENINTDAKAEDYKGNYSGTFFVYYEGLEDMQDLLELSDHELQNYKAVNGITYEVTAEYTGNLLTVYCPDTPITDSFGEVYYLYAWGNKIEAGVFVEEENTTMEDGEITESEKLWFLKDGSLYVRNEMAVNINGETVVRGVLVAELKPEFDWSAQEATEPELAYDPYYWDGDWYGTLSIESVEKGEMEATEYDIFANFLVKDDGSVELRIWDRGCAEDEFISYSEGQLTEGMTEAGSLKCKDGWFGLSSVSWVMDPAYSLKDQEIGQASLGVKDAYDAGGDKFSYFLYLRPWGSAWDNIYTGAEYLCPDFYEEEYLPLIEAGEPMPHHGH